MPILNSINQMQDEMQEWRQDLHRIPEIGLEEHKTSAYIKEKLKGWNIDFKDGYSKTGIVAWVKGSKVTSGKSIGLRADFDALPMNEKNFFDHKSTNKGFMHACGHDGHTTMLLGAAKYLSENNDFNGIVHFIFQPGEEGFGGGKIMIEDGMFEDFKIDEVYVDEHEKLKRLIYLSKKYKISMDEVAYIGDDVNDLEALKAVGFSGLSGNSPIQDIFTPDYITKRHGGQGAFREFSDLILHAQ